MGGTGRAMPRLGGGSVSGRANGGVVVRRRGERLARAAAHPGATHRAPARAQAGRRRAAASGNIYNFEQIRLKELKSNRHVRKTRPMPYT